MERLLCFAQTVRGMEVIMSTHKSIDKICCAAVICSLILTVLFMNGASLGIIKAAGIKDYAAHIFDATTVHTIDIVMDDWEEFLASCTDKEYALCSVTIDEEVFQNVAIRAKGNTSLTQVERYGNNRYSFKIEFDHYESAKSYHGLDKLSLNNIIQDNTYAKDFLTYQLMQKFDVAAPLCSYAYITVNGEEWGLYLAVECVEEAFLERNYGSDYGELYKPDSMDMDGGQNRGKPGDRDGAEGTDMPIKPGDGEVAEGTDMPIKPGDGEVAEGMDMWPKPGNLPDRADVPAMLPEKGNNVVVSDGEGKITPPELPKNGGMPNGGMGSSDVALVYTDDDPDSYPNLFDNAKTDITDADQNRLIAALRKMNNREDLEEVVDVEAVIRYFVVHNFVCNYDSYTGSMIHNYYLYEKDGQLSMIPWDYNLAFGGFEAAGDATSIVNDPIDSPVSGGTLENRPMIAWIFSDEQYKNLYHKYFAEFLSVCFESGYCSDLLDSVETMIAPYVEKDATKFCSFEEFQTGIDTLKEFCSLRRESISGQLGGTIPSTSDGQKQDGTSLIDASALDISAMGTMEMGKDSWQRPW